MEMCARNSVGVAVACAMAGMIVGVVSLTGLGLTFMGAMTSIAYGIQHEVFRLLAMLFLCMLASLVLGLGMPTTAKYVIMATVAAPVMVNLGVPLLAAHMFVFYFGVVADITPPVGLASYAGAAISKGDPLKTALIASRLAVAAFIVPFVFVLSPQMLFIDASVFDIISLSFTSIIGMTGVAAGLSGYFIHPLRWFERILLIAAGVAMIYPDLISDVFGFVIIFGLGFWQWYSNKKNAATVA